MTNHNVKQLITLGQTLALYAFIYNPWTKFPYTFLILIVAAFLISYTSSGSLKELGFRSQLSPGKVLGISLLLFICIEPVLDFIIQPLVNKLTSEIPDYSAFDSLKGNSQKFSKYLLLTWISAAFGEEIIFRGFLFRQFNILIPQIKYKNLIIILLSSILFSLPHLYLGLGGMIITFIFGLIFSLIYIRYNYNLWIVIIVHGLVDSLFITLVYFDQLSYYEIANRLLFGY